MYVDYIILILYICTQYVPLCLHTVHVCTCVHMHVHEQVHTHDYFYTFFTLIMIKHIIRFNPRATKKWDMPSSEKNTIIIFNRKILKIKYKNKNRYTWAKIKIFGVSLLKLPVKKLMTTEQALKQLDITI